MDNKIIKHISIIILSFLTMSSYSQSDLNSLIDKRNKHSMQDTIPIVSYLNTNHQKTDAAILINGKLLNETAIYGFDPQRIESINIIKDSCEINNIQFSGQVRVKTKKGYEPSFISLKELIFKYTNLKEEPGIIIFDDKIIFDGFSELLVDAKYILKIEVQEINNPENNIHFNLVKLITRTEENVKEANQIFIRGKIDIP